MTPEQNAHVKTLTTREEIFSYVEMHLRKQGHRSVEAQRWTHCRYRGEAGTSCAVGCLIADDEYDPDMEGKGPVVHGRANQLLPERLNSYIHMLEDLQHFHDTVSNWAGNWHPYDRSARLDAKGFSPTGEEQLRLLGRKWLG